MRLLYRMAEMQTECAELRDRVRLSERKQRQATEELQKKSAVLDRLATVGLESTGGASAPSTPLKSPAKPSRAEVAALQYVWAVCYGGQLVYTLFSLQGRQPQDAGDYGRDADEEHEARGAGAEPDGGAAVGDDGDASLGRRWGGDFGRLRRRSRRSWREGRRVVCMS